MYIIIPTFIGYYGERIIDKVSLYRRYDTCVKVYCQFRSHGWGERKQFSPLKMFLENLRNLVKDFPYHFSKLTLNKIMLYLKMGSLGEGLCFVH